VRVRSQADVPAPTFGDLCVGDVIVERSKRGNVTFTGVVRSTRLCMDFTRVHVTLVGTGKYVDSHKTWCAAEADTVECWTREI